MKIRSWLVVEPVADADFAYSSGADAIALDLSGTEDFPEPAHRLRGAWARLCSERILAALLPPFTSGRTEAAAEFAVRLGAAVTFLSGARSGAEVQRLDATLRVAELHNAVTPGGVAIVPLADASGLLAAGTFHNCSRRLGGIGWDRAFDPFSDTARLARATVGLAASASGVAAIDPASPTGDEAAFRFECGTARESGFVGKLCRLPAQIPIINDVFDGQSPAPAGRTISNTSAPPSA
ncbi:hypothetical protein [Rhizobium terrae]|uniref:hypothetical protein n=1 Tax=Rhizobium terrae TaxID=2171756 RepID=UPI0013C2BF10|nr:hypothetical protein [Rhizobium terrae]